MILNRLSQTCLSLAAAALFAFPPAGKALADEPAATAAASDGHNFDRNRLVAWCIVPFDARQRGPAERAAMVRSLGLTRVAYDWREKDVPTFEEEIVQYKKHEIEFFAFWSWHDALEPLIRKHRIRPQIWLMFSAPAEGSDDQKTKAAAEGLLPMVEKTRSLGLQLGLYNHGGWAGEPKNMVAVCQYLRAHHDANHVGIVYNLHHGHDHIAEFANHLKLMQPYLLCLNLNGMNNGAEPKILPIGSGQHELDLIRIIRAAKYAGPIGILDHRPELDAEESLRLNLKGLSQVLTTLGDPSAAATYK